MPDQIVFDAELMRRYERNGPRYTSYPTAAQFRSDFDRHAYRRAALLSNADPAMPLAAYVHVPFCASPCFYCGCNKVVTRDPAHAELYLQRLKKEIELQSQLFDVRRILRQLHFGGGTPTFLTVPQLENLLEHLDHHFRLDIAAAHEYSIEIDPRTLTEATLPTLKVLGFNRLSLGVQDFDPQVQRAVNRVQPVAQTRDAVQQARVYGYDSINFDLIYGLPLQTTAGFARTLEQVVEMRPNRIAAYGYAHMPQLFKPQQAIDVSTLPSPQTRLQLLQLTVEMLTAAGYIYIGLDHFALPGDELVSAQRQGRLQRNFQGYSTYAECDLIGLGVSAIGKLGDIYAQNAKQLPEYYSAIDQGVLPIDRGLALNVDDRTRRDVIQQIMCDGQLRYRSIEERYVLDFGAYFGRELRALEGMAADGLIVLSDDGFTVTPRGQLLLRNIAMVFDAHLQSAGANRFSQTI